MNKKINTSIAIITIITVAVILGGLIWATRRNIETKTPMIPVNHPNEKQQATSVKNDNQKNIIPNETQYEKLSYASDKLGVSFNYEITGNKAIICESGNLIFDVEGDSCPKSKEDIDSILANPDVLLEVFSKDKNQSIETAIKNIITKESSNNNKCTISVSDKIFDDPSMGQDSQDANRKIAKIQASGKMCSYFEQSETPDCAAPEDVCPSKYLNNGLSTLSNYFIYNPTESATKFAFHKCDCYEIMPNISIDINSVKFTK